MKHILKLIDIDWDLASNIFPLKTQKTRQKMAMEHPLNARFFGKKTNTLW
jgi:hypothetical protein